MPTGRDLPELPDLTTVAPMASRWMGLGRAFLRSAIRVRYDNHVHGAALVPGSGPVILASNHIGYLDGPLMFAVSPRPVHALTKQNMFDGRLGFAIGRLGQIPVDRQRVDVLAVKRCLRVLRDGGVVGIYPEGERGYGDVRRTRRGTAYLAMVSGAPVVPVACLGTRTDGGDLGTMPGRGARLDTVFGAPVRFSPVPWPRTADAVAVVQLQIQELLGEHVRAACEATGQSLPALPTEPRNP